jgi:cbb3-type cytochrome oxidase maturation protein
MPFLVVASIMVAGGFLVAFLWATRNGQYDDMETPSMKMIFEDEPKNHVGQE